MARRLPAWGATEPEIGGTIADALNSVYRRAQFLERVLGFLKTLGGLAPPCAVVPLVEQRAELAREASDIRRTLLPVVAPEIHDAISKSLDALDAQIIKIPTEVPMWVDAPSQWQAGAYEAATSVPTSSLRGARSLGSLDWSDVQSAASALLDVAVAGWLITMGPPGAVVAGVTYGGGIGEAIKDLAERRIGSVSDDLGAVLRTVVAASVRFEQRTKPSVYQQVLGAWMLTRSSSTPDIMRAGMTGMNPYLLPPMPEVWDGSFDHLTRESSAGESANWLIALLLGGFIGLSVAALTE